MDKAIKTMGNFAKIVHHCSVAHPYLLIFEYEVSCCGCCVVGESPTVLGYAVLCFRPVRKKYVLVNFLICISHVEAASGSQKRLEKINCKHKLESNDQPPWAICVAQPMEN